MQLKLDFNLSFVHTERFPILWRIPIAGFSGVAEVVTGESVQLSSHWERRQRNLIRQIFRQTVKSVSYTHLDVYKRQVQSSSAY